MFKITVNGKTHKFETLELASKCANEIHAKTGVIVGIEKMKPRMMRKGDGMVTKAHFKNDYRLSASESKRIKCNSCERPATTGQNNGSAPFWYHCDVHAQMGRELGRFYATGE